MKKKIFLTVFLLIILAANSVFALTTNLEIVEDNICKIDIEDNSYFEKKIVNSNLTQNEITLQLKITNEKAARIPSGEVMLVVDSSYSMNETTANGDVRKDVVLSSAQKLVDTLLTANSKTLKVGVVTFSSAITNETTGVEVGVAADAQVVHELSNNSTELKTSIANIQGTGTYTDLDAGITLAKSVFSNEDNNKYMIILTDGIPNLALGYNDLVTYNGLTDVITKTKSTLSSLTDINVITMLTGIANPDAICRQEIVDGETKNYTYAQVIEAVFGTTANPTVGKFYYIDDSKIEETITQNIYNDLLPIEYTLTDITVVDFFPQKIVDNFEMTYVSGIDVSNVSASIDKETNSITWNISKLEAGDVAIIQYNLKLKDDFDTSIINQILDTNQKVDINYKDFDNETQTKTSNVTPKIRILDVTKDESVSKDPLPETGTHTAIVAIIALSIVAIFFGIKSRKIK